MPKAKSIQKRQEWAERVRLQSNSGQSINAFLTEQSFFVISLLAIEMSVSVNSMHPARVPSADWPDDP